MPQVTMPQLGEGVEEGTIGKWLKGVGDHVRVGDPLVVFVAGGVVVVRAAGRSQQDEFSLPGTRWTDHRLPYTHGQQGFLSHTNRGGHRGDPDPEITEGS